MFTKLSSIEELKGLFFETFFNRTNKVTKIEDNSVLNGTGYGVSKVAQKAIKDVAIVEAHLFPDVASGIYLDNIAADRGIAARFGVEGSSTYIYLKGEVGTFYESGVHTFRSLSGLIFDLEEDITLGDEGFAYAKISSQGTGKIQNVDELSISVINPIPTGHQYCINEVIAEGGRDIEDDTLFRRRIKEGTNILSRGTLSALTQAAQLVNNNVLRIVYSGIYGGKTKLLVLTQNGKDLTEGELGDLLDGLRPYLSLSDLTPYAEDYVGVILENVTYYPIDISIRCQLIPSANADNVRKSIIQKSSKILDWRYWNSNKRISWSDLFYISKNTPEIEFLSDTYFSPNKDIIVPKNQFPRLRSFRLYDLDGNLISNNIGTLVPSFFPSLNNESFQASIL